MDDLDHIVIEGTPASASMDIVDDSNALQEEEANEDNKIHEENAKRECKVECGFRECSAKPMLMQNIKDHTRIKHPNAQGICVKGQPTLSVFF